MKKFKSAVLFSRTRKDQFPTALKSGGFYRDDLNALRLISENVIFTRTLKELLRHRPEIVVSYFYSYSIVVAIVCCFFRIKIIITGGADSINPKVEKNRFKRTTHCLLAIICIIVSNGILVATEEDKVRLQALVRFSKSQSRKIIKKPHVALPYEVDRIHKISQREFHCFTLCWFGSPTNWRRKGLDSAVRLIKAFRHSGVDATLTVYGIDGQGRRAFERFVKSTEMEEAVFYRGYADRDSIVSSLARHPIYVQLSVYEGFGVAAVEAFLSGLLIVHSGRGGLGEYIGDSGIKIDLVKLEYASENTIKFLIDKIKKWTPRDDLRNLYESQFSLNARAVAFYEHFNKC